MSATSIEVGPGAAAPVLQFVQQLRRRHARGAALDAALRTILSVAPPALVLAWLLPEWLGPLAAGLALLVAGQALVAALRARSLGAARLLQGAGVALGCDRAQLAELGDELATWLELQGRSTAPALLPWLTADVTARVPRLTPAQLAPLGRRRFGALLWMLPLLLVLLLAWLLLLWLAPPWSGVLGGGGAAGQSGSGAGGDGPATAGPGEVPPQDGPAMPPPRQPPTPTPPPPREPPPESPEEPQPEPPLEPSPLLELPEQQQFLLPEFLGDGPTRRVRMHAAELETGAEARRERPQRVDAAPTAATPLPTPEQFQRAAEAALRDRHVPPAERPMVRRFFEALRQVAR